MQEKRRQSISVPEYLTVQNASDMAIRIEAALGTGSYTIEVTSPGGREAPLVTQGRTLSWVKPSVRTVQLSILGSVLLIMEQKFTWPCYIYSYDPLGVIVEFTDTGLMLGFPEMQQGRIGWKIYHIIREVEPPVFERTLRGAIVTAYTPDEFFKGIVTNTSGSSRKVEVLRLNSPYEIVEVNKVDIAVELDNSFGPDDQTLWTAKRLRRLCRFPLVRA